MNVVKISLAAFAAVGFLAGCAEESNTSNYTLPSSQVLHFGDAVIDTNLKDKQIVVLSTQASYEAALSRYSTAPPKIIDFNKHQVLLVNLGEREKGGYGISVLPVELNESQSAWYVNVIGSFPGEGCSSMTALTTPYQFVQVNTADEILVSETIESNPCL